VFRGSVTAMLGWATNLEEYPDPTVVTDATLRAAIVATGFPWRVRDNASQIEMLLVPPGAFEMGCSASEAAGCLTDENPVHSVALTGSFYLGRYEVTQSQWTALMGTNPSHFAASNGYPGSDHRPVDSVTWYMARDFLVVAGMRLPTEAQWEYAYRAGTSTAFHSMPGHLNGTDNDGHLSTIAWWGGNSGTIGSADYGTKEVGRKAANGFGFHDMSGNLWEWVNDWYSSSYYASSPSMNPPGPSSGTYRVIRGGNWNHPSVNCRASSRVTYPVDGVNSGNGFRAARTP